MYSCAGKSGNRQETVAAACVMRKEMRVPSDTSHVQHYRHYASSVISSLRSVMTLRRALPAQTEGHNGECKRVEELPVFHRLRPPDESHRNQAISGAQIRRGETRQDLKIPTVSDGSLPRALSCSHREVYPLQTAVRWRFLIPTRATEFLVGGSLQAGLYARTPRSTRLPRLFR